eukprot:1191911-Prorocentrum_minimum.AAC.1
MLHTLTARWGRDTSVTLEFSSDLIALEHPADAHSPVVLHLHEHLLAEVAVLLGCQQLRALVVVSVLKRPLRPHVRVVRGVENLLRQNERVTLVSRSWCGDAAGGLHLCHERGVRKS